MSTTANSMRVAGRSAVSFTVLAFIVIANGQAAALEPKPQEEFETVNGISIPYQASSEKIAKLQEPLAPLPRLVEPLWLEEWKSLSASTDLLALYRYITRHPGKPAARTAGNRLRELISNASNIGMLSDFVRYTPADSEENALAKRRLTAAIMQEWETIERNAWMAALYTGTPEAFQRYLKKYPFGRHAQLAKERLKTLNGVGAAENSDANAVNNETQRLAVGREEAALAASEVQAEQQALMHFQDDAAWREAKQRDNELGFVLYLYSYPEGKYAVEAEAKLAALKAADTKRKEHDAAWVKAQREGTLRAYLLYLNSYPNGRHANDVLHMLKSSGVSSPRARHGHAPDYEREPLQRHSRPMQWLSEN